MHNLKVCHLTSAHPRYDTRIFLKQCSSLVAAGFDVTLVVADGLSDEEKSGVHILDVGKTKGGRLSRMIKTTNRVFFKAKEVNADVYHFHDPELIPVGLKLKKLGKIVIFDSHEDVPNQILDKAYINPVLRKIISKIYELYENYAVNKIDAVISATPFIDEKFSKKTKKHIDVNNYPIIDEFINVEISNSGNEKQVCYIGSISEIRGIKEIVEAMSFSHENVKLALGGKFTDSGLEKEVKSLDGWKNTIELGYVNREAIRKIFSTSVAGLVVLHPTRSYIDSLPVKMFEYMSAGLPVIASNFESWKAIIDRHKCGICVDPKSPKEIAEAIDYLIRNPEKIKEMGKLGRAAVLEKLNWKVEEMKLISFYKKLINP